MKARIMGEVRRTFRPEFLNRIDEVIVFHALTPEHIKEIVNIMLKEVVRRMREHEVELEVTDRARAWLAKQGFDEEFGARPLRRTIQREVEDRLSEELLKGTFQRGDRVVVDAGEDGIVVRKAERVA
jgi:ATP-dependent Clp protease ATP-binding subunit ClpC